MVNHIPTPFTCGSDCNDPPVGSCSTCRAPRCAYHLASCEVSHEETTCGEEFSPRWDPGARYLCDRLKKHTGDHHGTERRWYRGPVRVAAGRGRA